MIDYYLFLAAGIALGLLILQTLFHFASKNANKFWDDLVTKFLWLWLPFYGLQRLIREMFLEDKK
jgi:hypothetical protein